MEIIVEVGPNNMSMVEVEVQNSLSLKTRYVGSKKAHAPDHSLKALGSSLPPGQFSVMRKKTVGLSISNP